MSLPPRKPEPHPTTDIVPRLVRRRGTAHYLGDISLAQVDQLRAMGEITPVAMPGRLGRATRIPLYDLRDLDSAVERWKANGGQPR